MSPEGYEMKRNFVKRELGRFAASLFLEVSYLDFHLGDDGTEMIKIPIVNGNILSVDVTDMDLLSTTRAVLDVLAGGSGAEP